MNRYDSVVSLSIGVIRCDLSEFYEGNLIELVCNGKSLFRRVRFDRHDLYVTIGNTKVFYQDFQREEI